MRHSKKMIVVFALLICLIPLIFATNTSKDVTKAAKETEHTLYDAIYDHLTSFDNEFSIQYQGDTNKLASIIDDIMRNVKKQDIYLFENISKWKAKFAYTKHHAKITFQVDYITNQANEAYIAAELRRILAQIIAPSMSDVEKVKAIHDYIVLNTAYSAETLNSQYSPYTLLLEQKAVCQAYAFTFYRMLKEVGIEVLYVKGEAGQVLHGWNLVQLNGEWYHVDTTWNDPVPNIDGEVRYKYFLKTDEQMRLTHSWDAAEYPAATSMKYDYFQYVENDFTIEQMLYFSHKETDEYYKVDLKMNHLQKITAMNYQKKSAKK